MNKKLLSLLLAVAMVFSLIPTAFAAEEAKTEEKTVEEKAVEEAVEEAEEVEEAAQADTLPEFVKFLQDNKLVKGDENGDLMLDKELTRAEFTALLTRLDGQEATATAVQALPGKFSDVNATHWANGYVNVATTKNWIKGYPDGTFKPEREVTYAEVATVLVRYIGVDTTGFLFPAGYIDAAFTNKIFDKVDVKDYNAASIRQNVFQMLYNVISNRDFGKYNVYKAIVLENNRTANIGKDEVKIEVIDVVQESNQVEMSRAKKGQQIVFDLKDTKYDSEDLLGRVADFTVDGDKLVKVKVDDSYKYNVAPINWKITDAKKFNNISVRVDERYFSNRYDQQDNRMFRTYVTADYRADNYHYEDFVKLAESKRPNYARYTVKDGRVIFIDAYKLKDIAPVQEVKRDGADVYYYDDVRKGSVERMMPARRVIGYTAEKGFYNMDKKDIKADDVIHWMDGFTLVRQDARIDNKLEKTYVNADGEFAVVGEDDYFLNSSVDQAEGFRSVYAYAIDQFMTLKTRHDLKGMLGKDVKVLLDVFGDVQLITSDAKFADRVGLLHRFIQPNMRFYAPNAKDGYDLKANLDTDIVSVRGSKNYRPTQANNFDDFKFLDLVYTMANEDGEAEVIAQFAEYDDYAKDLFGFTAKKAVFEERGRYLNVAGREYRYNDNTEVFAVNMDGKTPYFVSTTMADVEKYNGSNKKLTAFVMDTKTFGDKVHALDRNEYYRYDRYEDYAKVVIFGNVNNPSNKIDSKKFAKVINVYSNREVTVEYANGMRETVKVVGGDLYNKSIKNGDIVVVKMIKDKENEVELDVAIAVKSGKFEDRSFDMIKVGSDIFKIDGLTDEFDYNKEKSTHATVYTFDGKMHSFADAIVYSTKAQETSISGLITKISLTPSLESIVLDNKTAYFLKPMTVLYDKNGTVEATGAQEVIKKLNEYDQVEVTISGNVMSIKRLSTEAERVAMKALQAAKDEAAKLDKDDYTTTSWKVLETALEMPENTVEQMKAKTKAIEDAITALEMSEDKKLVEAKKAVEKATDELETVEAAGNEDLTVASKLQAFQEAIDKANALYADAVAKVDALKEGTDKKVLTEQLKAIKAEIDAAQDKYNAQ